MNIIDTLLGMSREELRVLLAILTSACALFGYIFFALGKARGWRDRRNAIERDNVVVEAAIFRDLPDGRVEFAIETADRMPHLNEVFCNARLEARVRAQVTRCTPGEPLFPPGDDHYVAMERVGLLITGSDTIATQSALLGRHDEYYIDEVAVILTAARGEDGQMMPRIIKASPANLLNLLDPAFTARLVTLREVHRDYIPVLEGMARHHARAKTLFSTALDERAAGREAGVWTTHIRTQRTALLTEEQVRRIVREEMRSRVSV